MSRVFFHVQHLLGIGHIRRAAVLARTLAASGFDVLLVSGGAPLKLDLGRARFHQLPPVRARDEGLREMSFGVWEGKSVAQLRAEGGETFAAAERLGLDFHPPGGESPRVAMDRIAGWAREIAECGEPVVAVSHKAAIRALLALATGWDMTGRQPVKLDWKCLHFFIAHGDGKVTLDRPNVPLS